MTTLWIRAETKSNERRAPVSPSDASLLRKAGFEVILEASQDRAFSDETYASTGCQITETGSWKGAPADAFILGVKELPDSEEPLIHRHIHFGHVFKDQPGWQQM
ncbi:MAG: saccharopine dehydrogenase, partial [Pikeienuella sp.]